MRTATRIAQPSVPADPASPMRATSVGRCPAVRTPIAHTRGSATRTNSDEGQTFDNAPVASYTLPGYRLQAAGYRDYRNGLACGSRRPRAVLMRPAERLRRST